MRNITQQRIEKLVELSAKIESHLQHFTSITATKKMIKRIKQSGGQLIRDNYDGYLPTIKSTVVSKGKGARGRFWHEAGHAIDDIKTKRPTRIHEAHVTAQNKLYSGDSEKARATLLDPASSFHKRIRKGEIAANRNAESTMKKYGASSEEVTKWRKQMAPALNTYRRGHQG